MVPAGALAVVVLAGVWTCFSLKREEASSPASARPSGGTAVVGNPKAPSASTLPQKIIPPPRAPQESGLESKAAEAAPDGAAGQIEAKTAEPAPGAAPEPSGSTSVAQELLADLAKMSEASPLTEEDIEHLRQGLELVVAQGSAAVPAIAEYLESKENVKFKGGEDSLKYASLRVLAITALEQIGGPESVEAAVNAIKDTTEPLEIALLARALEKLEPAGHREVEITTARDTLARVLNDELTGLNTTPLFELLQKFGDAQVAPDLEKSASKWNYYATLALAGLPDGAGVPSLIRLSRDPAVLAIGNGDIALRPLAQVSLIYPEARTALMEQARANEIPDAAWPEVATTLAGNHIQYGSRIFGSTTAPVDWSQSSIRERIALIEEVRAVAYSRAAIGPLEKARASLLERLHE